MSVLPEIADIETPLSDAELEVLRKQFEREGKHVTSQTKFNYAWGLLKSKNDKHQLQGIRLLTELCKEAPDRERESLYYLALGHYRRGHYANARQCIMQLLIRDPNNPQAQKLRTVIDGKVKRDGIIGLGIVSGILIGIGAVAVHFLRKK